MATKIERAPGKGNPRQRLDDIAAQLRSVAAVVESMDKGAALNIENATRALEALGEDLRSAAASQRQAGKGDEPLDDHFLQTDTLARARSELASGESDVQG